MTTPRVTDEEIEDLATKLQTRPCPGKLEMAAAILFNRLLAERQAEKGEAVGEYLANVDEYGGIRWIGAKPPQGTKLYTRPPKPRDLAVTVPEAVARDDDNYTAYENGWNACREAIESALSSLQEPKK